MGQDLHLQNLAVAELVSAALLGATVGALCGQARGWPRWPGGWLDGFIIIEVS